MKYLTVSSRQIASVRRWSIAPARRPPCCIDPASVPQGVYQFSDRVHDPATDSEQDHPYQIVDLLSEIGNSQLHRLRSPEEDGSQEQDDRYRSHKNRDQLVHKGCSSMRITPQLLAKLVALDLAGRRARQIAGHFEPPWPLVGLRFPIMNGWPSRSDNH